MRKREEEIERKRKREKERHGGESFQRRERIQRRESIQRRERAYKRKRIRPRGVCERYGGIEALNLQFVYLLTGAATAVVSKQL